MLIRNQKGMLVVAILGILFLVFSALTPAKPPIYSPLQTAFVGLLLLVWAGVSYWRSR